MGLLDGTTQRQYYEANTFGGYQFTSLDDIITQFEIAYVGENKIIPKAKRTDIAFYAQRALQELSFDTFKSVKSQQIELPPSMVMPLPHDYVNYTQISWPDSSGIKHPLYPTKHTSNPFQIEQDAEGLYQFDDGLYEHLLNIDFDDSLAGTWNKGSEMNLVNNALWVGSPDPGLVGSYSGDSTGTITFNHRTLQNSASGDFVTSILTLKQTIDVTGKSVLDISATGLATNTTTGGAANPAFLRVGVVTDFSLVGDGSGIFNHTFVPLMYSGPNGHASETSIFDLVDSSGNPSYVEWSVAGDNTATKQITGIDVSNVNSVDVVVISFIDPVNVAQNVLDPTNTISNVSAMSATTGKELYQASLTSPTGNEKNSSTWNSYKSITPSENNNDDYEDDTYWPLDGNRYGLEPSHAQVNGSFYIDNRLGRIHFSSNISGKTVILDYISDSLGTDAEMQVHKFAEEAMYKWIAHAILSTSSYGQPLVPRLTKEKFAAVRKAKLRLSNIKLEELTQILRGKSKQIKH